MHPFELIIIDNGSEENVEGWYRSKLAKFSNVGGKMVEGRKPKVVWQIFLLQPFAVLAIKRFDKWYLLLLNKPPLDKGFFEILKMMMNNPPLDKGFFCPTYSENVLVF